MLLIELHNRRERRNILDLVELITGVGSMSSFHINFYTTTIFLDQTWVMYGAH